MMRCIYCNATESRVVDSRPTEEGSAIRRRRECLGCGRRFTTYEKIETVPIMVIKKDNRREAFDLDKLRRGVLKACEKRPVALAKVDELCQDVEMQITNSLSQEISSTKIGEMVMTRLKDLDEVAYVRFASVYRQFRDLNSFMEELKTILSEKD